MSTNELNILETYLRQIALIEAYKLISSDELIHKSNAEKIIFLNKLDFSVDDIAQIVNTTAGTVRKELSINKAKREKENGDKSSDKALSLQNLKK